jgi:glycosyltransferase involved in cell wall biosynthesis
MRDNRIIYLGSFLDEAIVQERGLRSHNPAGSNRIKRLSLAMRASGFRPIVVSPATSLRAHMPGGPLLHPARVRRMDGIAVVYAPAVNMVLLGTLTTLFFQIAVIRRVLRRRLAGSVIYNFSPVLVLIALWLALKPQLRVVNNVEDVSVPSLSDWSRKTEARPVQQLIFWVCMNLVARLSDSYIVPTKRFLAYLPPRPTEVVTGCISAPLYSDTPLSVPPLRVLYAGKVEREHGIVQFADALLLLDTQPVAKRIQVDISGAGPLSNLLAEKLKSLKTLQAIRHGFVSADSYGQLLSQAHVCVALQNPQGRYSDFKTPSKIYEFLGFGKAVISTTVGDINELPPDVLILLDQLDAQAIATHIAALADDSDRVLTLQMRAREHALSTFAYAKVGERIACLFEKES